MADKILNTRIQLKYDSLDNWTKANTLLKQGEVAVAYLPPKGAGEAPAAVSEAVLMKVGPGNFNELPFVSALAADVYSWAKENKLTITKVGTGNVVSGIEWDANANGGKGGIKFTTAAVATAEGLEELQTELYGENGTKDNSRIDKLEKDIADNRAAWEKDDNTTYTFAKTTDGKGVTITPSTGNGSTISFAFLTEDEIKNLGFAYASDLEDYTPTANLDAKITELNYAKKATTLAGYGIGNAYTKTEVDTAIQGAKDYADQHDANTEYHVEYDSTAKKIKLVAGADASKMEIPTDDFIKDGMIQSVAISEDGQNLVITWNTDAGKEATEIPLSELVDVMTGVDGTTITVSVSADDKISAEVKTNSLKDGHIAADAAIAKSKLATDVQTSLGKADTAVQPETLGDLATKDNITASLVTDFATEVAKVKVTNATNADNATKATQDGNGNNIASTYATKDEATYTAGENILIADDRTISVNPELTNIKSITAPSADRLAITGGDAVQILDNKSGANIDVSTDINLTPNAQGAVKINNQPIHAIATSGNVNDLVQTAGDVLVFNCGTSTEVI